MTLSNILFFGAAAGGSATPATPAVNGTASASPAASTVTSKKGGRRPQDWDKLAQEVEKEESEEKLEGDAALNKLFKQIYGNGRRRWRKKIERLTWSPPAHHPSVPLAADEDTRRAMMKSFSESNGTVLSTNWSEVSKGKVRSSALEQLCLGLHFQKLNVITCISLAIPLFKFLGGN